MRQINKFAILALIFSLASSLLWLPFFFALLDMKSVFKDINLLNLISELKLFIILPAFAIFMAFTSFRQIKSSRQRGSFIANLSMILGSLMLVLIFVVSFYHK